jgi:nucleoside 2-deoxyribosyltransferase
MIVIGGIYFEDVVAPESREWAGSGLRAAAALSRRGSPPTLHTAVDGADVLDAEQRARTSIYEVEMVAAALGVSIDAVERSERVGFRYVTPVSAPAVNGPNSRIERAIVVDAPDETVLMFGMIEAKGAELTAQVNAKLLVLDPQRPRDAKPLDLTGTHAERVVIVANVGEIRGLGRSAELRIAAATILEENRNVTGVVTKRGAAGCLVSQRVGDDLQHDAIGAHPTRRVWPIGSGDVFSAGLAHALDIGKDLTSAARIASASAAHWCSTRVHAVPPAILAGDLDGLAKPISPSTPKVYLAGPFFTIGERWLVETVRDELISLGVDVWSPVHEVGHGGIEVAQQDLDGLLECDVVLALLDRSDPGTIFEVGWAVRTGLPVVGYATVGDDEGMKMLGGTAVELHSDLSTACYRAAWAGMGLRTRPGWMK